MRNYKAGESLTRAEVRLLSEHYGDYWLLPVELKVPLPYEGTPSDPVKYRVWIHYPHGDKPWNLGRASATTPEKAMELAKQMVNDMETVETARP